MAMNVGYIEMTVEDRDVVVRIYYDQAWLVGNPDRDPGLAPLVNGPRGYCLDITNVSGRRCRLVVSGLTDQPINVAIAQGDPVTTGPVAGRSRTAAQLASAGYTNRGSVGNLQIGDS